MSKFSFSFFLVILLSFCSACGISQKRKADCKPFKNEKQETQFLNTMHLELYSDQAFEDSLIAIEIKRMEKRRIEYERTEDSLRIVSLRLKRDSLNTKEGFDMIEEPVKRVYATHVHENVSFQGGVDYFFRFFKENLGLCKSFSKVLDKQMYSISFDITPDGKIAHILWKVPAGELFMKEVNRCIMKSSGLWRPARFNGKNYLSKAHLVIRFKK